MMRKSLTLLSLAAAAVTTAHAQSPRLPTAAPAEAPAAAPAAAPTPESPAPTPAVPALPSSPLPPDPANAQAAAAQPIKTVQSCAPLIMPQGTSQRLDANINVASHLIFPIKIADALVSTPLWNENFHDNDLWIRPNQPTASAGTVGLSVALADGRKYDFVVRSVPESKQSCYLVVPYPFSVSGGQAAALDGNQIQEALRAAQQTRNRVLARERDRVAADLKMQQQRDAVYEQNLIRMRSEMAQQSEDRIKQFERSIHTAYDWENHELVTSVYDDGETTYVRVARSGYGVPSVTGLHDGQNVALQSDYDDLTGVYTIPGLFDRFIVQLGTNAIKIVRKG